MRQNYFLGLGLILLLTACNNPFPKDAKFSSEVPDTARVFPAMTLDFPTIMEFKEGIANSYTIEATVESGEPIISVQGLPTGAVFNPQAKTISWTPGFFDGNDPQNRNEHGRNYPITIRLQSDRDAVSVMERNASIFVKDVPRAILIWTDAQATLQEGRMHEQNVLITSEDFDDADVTLAVLNLPQSATLERNPNDPSRYKIRYMPSMIDVTTGDPHDANGHYRKLDIRLRGITPGGQSLEQTIQWTIRDQRHTPLVVGPTRLEAKTDISFTLSTQDSNEEVPPTIQLVARPPFGQLTVEQIPSLGQAPHTSTYLIRWFDFPASYIGTEEKLDFSVCIPPTLGERAPLCSAHSVLVTISGNIHTPPIFDRSAWPLGSMQQVREGETLNFSLPIRDSETMLMLGGVQIASSSNAAEIAWHEGQLRVKGLRTGLLQFDILAVSPFGVAQKESMVLEILPHVVSPTTSNLNGFSKGRGIP